MPSPSGSFTWYELMTTDIAGAAKFYGEVVGWTSRSVSADNGGLDYSVFNVGESGVAGMLALTPGGEGPGPVWVGYVSVDNLDVYIARILEAGGKQHRPAVEVPGMLRFSVMADPQGAIFVLFQPYSDAPPPPALPDRPGFAAWRELMAADGDAAFDFYSAMFGWTKADAHDMGPMGVYQLFADGGETVGGMMTKPPMMPQPFWNFYFQVDGAQAAMARLTAAGGTMLNGPHQVPTGLWVLQARDPQGASFCLVSDKA